MDPECIANLSTTPTIVVFHSSGATTVTVSINATNGNDAVYNAVAEELIAQFGVSHPNELADELLFFMPTAALDYAFSSENSHQSFYNINGWYVSLLPLPTCLLACISYTTYH